VAQVERVEQIEPLPDIDFNIRAGNTLVGFSTLEQVRKSLEGTLGFGEQQVDKIKEEAKGVESIFKLFREQQTKHGGKVTAADKQELRKRLEKLDLELDRYLAGEYGIATSKKSDAFEEWRKSYQPFHWFVEFYGIMSDGGFDAIIGNPPYVELKEITSYKLLGYECLSCGNLYALVMERCVPLCSSLGRLGFIVPVSSVSTDRYLALQTMVRKRQLHYSSYDDRPSRLFDGLEHIRLTIHLIGPPSSSPACFSTRYNKWSATQRPQLFQTIVYSKATPQLVEGTLPKLTSSLEEHILAKLVAQKARLVDFCDKGGQHPVYYSRKIGYYLQVLNFEPRVLDGKGKRRPPSEFKELGFKSNATSKLALCCLNSSLFYWFLAVFSDCRHVNKREVETFPANLLSLASTTHAKKLEKLAQQLMDDIEKNSEHRKMKFKHDHLTVQCIYPRRSKEYIDKIDEELFEFFGFTPEEQDFIRSYDIKYRLGVDNSGDKDED
jgi:hypothetical protein